MFHVLGLLNRCYNPSYATDERIPLNTDNNAHGLEREASGSNGKNTLPNRELIPSRWIMAILGCFGFISIYALKVNLSVVILAMVNHTAVDIDKGPPNINLPTNCEQNEAEEKLQEDGPFVWDEKIQGVVLGSYFYGYIITQIPGGWLAQKFSAKHVFGCGLLLNVIFSLLSPEFAKMSYVWLVILRVGMGITAGVTLPAMHVLIANWAPPQERSKIASTVYTGMTLGTLMGLPLSGIVASDLGWETVFYLQGGFTLLWYLFWLFLVFDSPEKHPRISASEKNYIKDSIRKLTGGETSSHEGLSIPWKQMWTSPVVWAIIIAHTCGNWGWYMLLMELPSYLKHILHFSIKANAGLSALPFLCMWLFSLIFASFIDFFRSKDLLSTTLARKIATCVACILPGSCLVLVTYANCSKSLAVLLLTLATMFIGAMYSGFLANHIDIAQQFSGTLMGISNTFATLSGIIVPSFVGSMTQDGQTLGVWRQIFVISFGIMLLGAVTFCLLGSGEQQSWAKKDQQNDSNTTTKESYDELKEGE